jgi:outer membrane lipoprotein-sorting protein
MTVKPAAVVVLLAGALASAEPLANVLARMDRAAGNFQSLSAKTRRVQYTAVLNETSESRGTLYLKRMKNAIAGVVNFQEPDQKTFYISGKTAEIYYPKANTVEIYDTSKFASNIDQFLLIGFGTTSNELKKSYEVKGGSTEAVNGVSCTRIELLPKSAELKKLITKIELWIPEGQSNPIREKVTEPSKNYDLVDYADIKVNPPLPPETFELKLPAGVKKVYPQK